MSVSKLCLCVQFDPDFYYLIQTYAERCGLRAMHSPRGQDMLSSILEQRPDVILLDGDKPAQITAWNLLKMLKDNPSTGNIPIIFFSWLNEEERALEEGADVFVQKAVMYADFLDALAMAGVLEQPGTALEQDKTTKKGGGSVLSEE